MSLPIPPKSSQVIVYVIFISQDTPYVDYIESKLGEKGIELKRYDKEFYSGRRLDQIYRDWADKSDAVLLLISNGWNKIQDYMDGELAVIQQKQTEWRRDYGNRYKLQNKAGKILEGRLQFAYPVAIEPIQDQALNIASYFGDFESIVDEDLDEFLTKFITRLRSIKTYIDHKSNFVIAVPNTRAPQTASLQSIRFSLKELLQKPVSAIWTSPAQSFSLGQYISSLTFTGDLLHIRHYPIVDESNRVVSILSLRDILALEIPDREVLDWLKARKLLEYSRPRVITPSEVTVYDIVKEKLGSAPITVTSETLISEAIRLLRDRHTVPNSRTRRYISALPVVDNNNLLMGMTSYLDVISKVKLPDAKVKNWMRSTDEGITTVSSNATIAKANRDRGDYRDLPVLDPVDNTVVGMLSEYELLKNMHPDFPATNDAPVSLIMKQMADLPAITPETTIEELVSFFRRYKTIGCIAVTDGQVRPQLVGLISYIDLLRRFLD